MKLFYWHTVKNTNFKVSKNLAFLFVIALMIIMVIFYDIANNTKLSKEIENIKPQTVVSLDSGFSVLSVKTNELTFKIRRKSYKGRTNRKYFLEGKKIYVLKDKVVVRTIFGNLNSYKFIEKYNN